MIFPQKPVVALQTVEADIGKVALAVLQSPYPPTIEPLLTTFFNSRGPVLAIPIAILIGQGLFESLGKRFAPWFPWQILPAKLPDLASRAARDDPLPSFVPIVAVLLFSLAFVRLAIWRFEREEF